VGLGVAELTQLRELVANVVVIGMKREDHHSQEDDRGSLTGRKMINGVDFFLNKTRQRAA
jgi:hypothetical protein